MRRHVRHETTWCNILSIDIPLWSIVRPQIDYHFERARFVDFCQTWFFCLHDRRSSVSCSGIQQLIQKNRLLVIAVGARVTSVSIYSSPCYTLRRFPHAGNSTAQPVPGRRRARVMFAHATNSCPVRQVAADVCCARYNWFTFITCGWRHSWHGMLTQHRCRPGPVATDVYAHVATPTGRGSNEPPRSRRLSSVTRRIILLSTRRVKFPDGDVLPVWTKRKFMRRRLLQTVVPSPEVAAFADKTGPHSAHCPQTDAVVLRDDTAVFNVRVFGRIRFCRNSIESKILWD